MFSRDFIARPTPPTVFIALLALTACAAGCSSSAFGDFAASSSEADGAVVSDASAPAEADPGAPAPVLFQSRTLDRPVAVGAWIQISFVETHEDAAIDSIVFEPEGVFVVEQDIDPIHVRAVAEGASTMTVTTTAGSVDSVYMEALAVDHVTVSLPGDDGGLSLFGGTPVELADGAPLVLSPHGSLRVRGAWLDAAGATLKGEGAGVWSVSDAALAEIEGSDLSDYATLTALDGSGVVTVHAGPGDALDVEIHPGVEPVVMTLVDHDSLHLSEVSMFVGGFELVSLRTIDADDRYVHGYGGDDCGIESDDPAIATLAAGFSVQELEEDVCELLGSGLMALRAHAKGDTTVRVRAGAQTLEVPVHVQ